MQIKPIIRKIALGATTLIATSCHEARGPLQKVTSKDQIDTKLVSYLSSQTEEVLKDTTYKLYARDTIKIHSPLALNTNTFKDDIAIASDAKNPKVITGWWQSSSLWQNKHKNFESLEYTNKFLEPKGFIKNELFQSKNGDLFVPVEIYGKKNPDPKLKRFK